MFACYNNSVPFWMMAERIDGYEKEIYFWLSNQKQLYYSVVWERRSELIKESLTVSQENFIIIYFGYNEQRLIIK
jgi:hypothetical protein